MHTCKHRELIKLCFNDTHCYSPWYKRVCVCASVVGRCGSNYVASGLLSVGFQIKGGGTLSIIHPNCHHGIPPLREGKGVY